MFKEAVLRDEVNIQDYKITKILNLSVRVHANPSPWELQAGGLEFKVMLGYTEQSKNVKTKANNENSKTKLN